MRLYGWSGKHIGIILGIYTKRLFCLNFLVFIETESIGSEWKKNIC